jgi:hypothetical protein
MRGCKETQPTLEKKEVIPPKGDLILPKPPPKQPTRVEKRIPWIWNPCKELLKYYPMK